MPTAFDPEGRLKKHALLGTSLAQDPAQGEQREAFKALQSEARGATRGRIDMSETLGRRFQQWGGKQVQRLGEIARRKGSLEAQAAGIGDPNIAIQLSQAKTIYERWQEATAKAPHKNPAEFLPKEQRKRADKAWNQMSLADRNQWAIDAGATHHGSPSSLKKAFAVDFFNKTIGRKATTKLAAYEADINARIDKLNEEYLPLQEEGWAREKRLADRIELYNMFLGE